MKLNDGHLQQIVYLGWPSPDSEEDIAPIGTGFLVSHKGAFYIVTAAHVAWQFRDDAPFAIRLNKTADGRGKVVRVDSAKWFLHPSDDTIDVAVMPFAPPDWAKLTAFSTKHVLTDFKRETKRIGPGDLVYVVGVFKLVPGERKNNPFVHVGHLASWADDEELPATDWRSTKNPPPRLPIRGYLVQVRTMEQASGSPVFVRRSIEHFLVDPNPRNASPGAEKIPMLRAWTYGSVWLLGLWHGAFSDDVGAQLGLGKGTIELGGGIGITIPATQILEVLNNPELVKARDMARRETSTPIVEPEARASSEADAEGLYPGRPKGPQR